MLEEQEKVNTSPAIIEPEFVFANEDDQAAGIFTKTYPNGSEVKMVKLRNGSQAVIRQLKGRDAMEVNKRVTSDKDSDYQTHCIAVSTKVNGVTQPAEYYLDELSQQEYTQLLSAYAALNFQ